MNELPENWEKSTIGDVYEVIGGGTPSTNVSNYWNGTIPWITSADIHGVRDIEITRFVSEEGITNSTTNKVPPRTLLVVTRVGLGKIAIAPHDICFSQDLQGLVQSPDVIWPEYALYFLSYELQKLKFEGRGTTISGITKKQLKDVVLPLPPLNEQKRIVAKIEELFSELDSGIENLKTAREQLKVYRQAVLKHTFDNAGGRQTTLGKLLNYVTSGSRGWAQYYSDVGELFIRAQNLKYDRLDLTERAYVSLPNKTEGTRTKVHVGDLLITITGANVTKSALVETDLGTAYVSQHVALCRPVEGVFPKFLHWFVIAEAAGRKQLAAAAYGAGKPGLNLDNIKSVKISIPPHDQQLTIVQKIEAQLSVCENLHLEIDSNLQKSEVLRQSILKKAFSGQLVAQDAKDEPASVLLKRISAQKTAAPATKKRRAA